MPSCCAFVLLFVLRYNRNLLCVNNWQAVQIFAYLRFTFRLCWYQNPAKKLYLDLAELKSNLKSIKMALWVDKYRPRDLSKLDYHVEQANDLKRLCEQQDFPHLMFFGPSGAGKKTRIMCILRELYGTSAERLRSETMTFTTPSNRKIEIMTVSSNYHIEGEIKISQFSRILKIIFNYFQ